MRNFFILFLAVLLFCAPSVARAELINGVAAVVADSVITFQQVDLFTTQNELAVRSQYGSQSELYYRRMVEVRSNGLELLVERQLILHDFDVSGFSVPDAIIDEYVQDEIHDRYSDRVQFTKELQAQGLTLEQFRSRMRENLIVTEMTRKNVPDPIISPHRIEQFYNEHHEDFKVQDEIKTRMIVINQSATDDPGTAKKRATEILSQIKGGASFEEMARVYSDGSQRSEGGENGWQEVSVLNKAIVDPLAKLKTGEYSGVIETPSACFIVQLEDRRPAHYRPLSDLRDEIERTLMAQDRSEKRKQWIARLKKKTFFRYFEPI